MNYLFKLTALAKGILRYCGMEATDLTVVTKNEKELEHAAGTYSSDGRSSVINIRVTASSRPNILHSVLIHECMRNMFTVSWAEPADHSFRFFLHMPMTNRSSTNPATPQPAMINTRKDCSGRAMQ